MTNDNLYRFINETLTYISVSCLREKKDNLWPELLIQKKYIKIFAILVIYLVTKFKYTWNCNELSLLFVELIFFFVLRESCFKKRQSDERSLIRVILCLCIRFVCIQILGLGMISYQFHLQSFDINSLTKWWSLAQEPLFRHYFNIIIAEV